MFVRLLKLTSGDEGYEYAEEFKARCILDGVPEQLFDTAKVSKLNGLPTQFKSVKASRIAGDGSTLARVRRAYTPLFQLIWLGHPEQ